MALIVEDGAGRSDAESFISVADADTYFTARGNTDWADAATADKEAALRRASQFLTFAFIWQGQKVNRRDQALAWPRYGMSDRENWPVLPTEVPVEVKNACCEIAAAELASPGTMNPTVTPADKVRSEQVGPIRVEYVNLFTAPGASRPVLTMVSDLLWPFLETGAGNSLVGRTYRA